MIFLNNSKLNGISVLVGPSLKSRVQYWGIIKPMMQRLNHNKSFNQKTRSGKIFNDSRNNLNENDLDVLKLLNLTEVEELTVLKNKEELYRIFLEFLQLNLFNSEYSKMEMNSILVNLFHFLKVLFKTGDLRIPSFLLLWLFKEDYNKEIYSFLLEMVQISKPSEIYKLYKNSLLSTTNMLLTYLFVNEGVDSKINKTNCFFVKGNLELFTKLTIHIKEKYLENIGLKSNEAEMEKENQDLQVQILKTQNFNVLYDYFRNVPKL